jgi:hypothetical protein
MTAQKLTELLKEARTWMDSYVKPAGELDKQYGVMVFKARKGNYAIVKRIVDDYVRKSKKIDPDIIVMEDIDDNLVKSWLVGNKDKIVQMVNDSLQHV